MVSVFNKVAAGLAVIIGLMAVFAGGRVLLGYLPDYDLISWLPPYNFLVGVLTVLVSSVLIWRNNSAALPIAAATFSLHAVVMLILQTVYRNVVAIDSIQAMTIRLVVWGIILSLLIVQQRKLKSTKFGGT